VPSGYRIFGSCRSLRFVSRDDAQALGARKTRHGPDLVVNRVTNPTAFFFAPRLPTTLHLQKEIRHLKEMVWRLQW